MSIHFKDLRFDDLGRPIQQKVTQTNKSQNKTSVQIFPTKAIPIVFLPGIMGSPLRAKGTRGDCIKKGNKWAWFPDGQKGWVAGMKFSGYGGEGFANTTGEERRQLLDPEATWALTPSDEDIDEDIIDAIKKSLILESNWFSANVTAMSEKEALKRGWATIYWAGYGGILSYLEKYLRYITYSDNPYSQKILALGDRVTVYDSIKKAFNTVIKSEDRRFNAVLEKDFPDVNPASASSYKNYLEQLRPILQTGRKYHYPVFAVGYNWTRCNADSAEYVYDRIANQIIPHVQNTLGYSCDDGVIIMTHSMGGLVGRSLVKQFPDLKVQAVIHDVQPCNGAATLYARMWAGWEGGKNFFSGPVNYIVASVGGTSLGRTRAELLPILTQSPGAMELSPNQNYAKGWLRIYDDNTGNLIKSLPQSDPYSEIYLQTDNWLRLGSFKQMNPGKTKPEEIEKIEEGYTQVIDTAQAFHQKIDNFFHENTYLVYGQFSGYTTWGAVNLRVRGVTLTRKSLTEEELSGATNIDRVLGVVKEENVYKVDCIVRTYNKDTITPALVGAAVFRYENASPERESGKVDISYHDKTYQVHMEGGQEPGDGTVPYNSGNPWKSPENPWDKSNWNNHYKSAKTPNSIQYIFECTKDAYEHSEAYNAEITQNIAFYSIMSVIKNKLS